MERGIGLFLNAADTSYFGSQLWLSLTFSLDSEYTYTRELTQNTCEVDMQEGLLRTELLGKAAG